MTAELRLERWSEGDLELLRRANTPEMWAHLGGPETEEQVLARHQRFLRAGWPGGGGMFRVVRAPDSEAVGMVGYWERVWHDAAVYEAGWQVLTEYQGRGIAGAAVALLLDHAATHAASRAVHAFPSVDTRRRMRCAASSASCGSANATSNSRPGIRCGATTGAGGHQSSHDGAIRLQ